MMMMTTKMKMMKKMKMMLKVINLRNVFLSMCICVYAYGVLN